MTTVEYDLDLTGGLMDVSMMMGGRGITAAGVNISLWMEKFPVTGIHNSGKYTVSDTVRSAISL